jgi:hypothetical protein
MKVNIIMNIQHHTSAKLTLSVFTDYDIVYDGREHTESGISLLSHASVSAIIPGFKSDTITESSSILLWIRLTLVNNSVGILIELLLFFGLSQSDVTGTDYAG